MSAPAWITSRGRVPWTAGPWYAHEALGSQAKCGVTAIAPYNQSKGAVRRIAWLGSAGPTRGPKLDAEDMANANLIAAAPELYEALVEAERLLSNHAVHEDDLPPIRAVLAKARGESA